MSEQDAEPFFMIYINKMFEDWSLWNSPLLGTIGMGGGVLVTLAAFIATPQRLLTAGDWIFAIVWASLLVLTFGFVAAVIDEHLL